MLRRLLNIASIVCVVLCVALMGMWVRSYRYGDELHGHIAGTDCYLVTAPGRFKFEGFYLPSALNDWSSEWKSGRSLDPRKLGVTHAGGIISPLGFGAEFLGHQAIVDGPYWFLVLTAGSLAMAFRLPWPLRFTLRSLFIATTFLAVVLGMIAWLDRAWIGK
jgi:hypothetical protein